MRFDRTALSRLLQLNDRQLLQLVNKLAEEYGLDLSAFAVKEGDAAGIRQALRNASDEEIADLMAKFSGGGK